MFFITKNLSKQYYSFFNELILNIAIFILFQFFFLFQPNIEIIATSEEFKWCFLFSLMSLIFLISLNISKKFQDYKLELINIFMFSSNVMFSIGLILHFLNIFVLIPSFEMVNFHKANIFILTVLGFIFFVFRYRAIEDYLIGAMSDVMLKNVAYKKLKLNYRAISEKSVKINKKATDESVVNHEVGHLMFLIKNINENSEVIASIIPDRSAKGFVASNIFTKIETKKEYQNMMLYLIGGLASDYYESEVNDIEISAGAASDLTKFTELSIKYLSLGFSNKMCYLNKVPSKSDFDSGIDIISHNNTCLNEIYRKSLNIAIDYIIENKEVYEELKKHLRKEKVLYNDDLLIFRNKIKEVPLCDF